MDGEGIFLREDGTVMSERLVREIDDLVRTVCDDMCESPRPTKEHENVGFVIKNKFEEYLRTKNDCSTKKMMKEIFDWNQRFLIVDNSCHSLDDLSAMLWGNFKVNFELIYQFQSSN